MSESTPSNAAPHTANPDIAALYLVTVVTIDDDVVAVHDLHDVARVKTSVVHLDFDIRVQLLNCHARRLNFALSNAIHIVKNLTLKV
jgi:hypothetical protein